MLKRLQKSWNNVNVEQIVKVKFNEVTKQLDEKYDSSQSDRFDSVDAKFDKLQSLLARQGDMLQTICKQYIPTDNKPNPTNMEEESDDSDTFMNYKPPPLPQRRELEKTPT